MPCTERNNTISTINGGPHALHRKKRNRHRQPGKLSENATISPARACQLLQRCFHGPMQRSAMAPYNSLHAFPARALPSQHTYTCGRTHLGRHEHHIDVLSEVDAVVHHYTKEEAVAEAKRGAGLHCGEDAGVQLGLSRRKVGQRGEEVRDAEASARHETLTAQEWSRGSKGGGEVPGSVSLLAASP
jgi:hypothetical protein